MSSSTVATTLVCTSSHSAVSASPFGDTQPLMLSKKASPRIAIPAATAARALKSMELAGVVPIITPKGLRDTSAEKVGRWSEEEHHVFLKGLEQHGKQWKVIAGMIGTRTVVQVRTHAQKYFQRMDRASKPPAKRKMSLPDSMPSRSNKKPRGSPNKKTKRAASISLGTSAEVPIPHYELPTYPSYVSNSSSMSSDSNWTMSPSRVMETDDQFDIFETIVSTGEEALNGAEDIFDFKELGQDPLEWLVEAEPSILPESSLPMFPDLSSGGHASHHDYSQAEAGLHENHVVEDSMSSSGTETSYHVNENILSSIVDPNVTVQSLFLLPE